MRRALSEMALATIPRIRLSKRPASAPPRLPFVDPALPRARHYSTHLASPLPSGPSPSYNAGPDSSTAVDGAIRLIQPQSCYRETYRQQQHAASRHTPSCATLREEAGLIFSNAHFHGSITLRSMTHHRAFASRLIRIDPDSPSP